MDTIAKRMEWVLQQGRVANANAWSVAAQLSRQHVSTYLARVRKRGAHEVDIGADTLRALARAGNVRTSWLMTGQEPREPYEGDEPAPAAPPSPPPPPPAVPERVVVLDPRYPNLEAVIEYWARAKPGRWSDPAIAAARSRSLHAESDPTPADWEAWLDAIESAIASAERGVQVGTPVEDDFQPPFAKRRER